MPISNLFSCFRRSESLENGHITFMSGEDPIYGRENPKKVKTKEKGKVVKFFLGMKQRFVRLFSKKVTTPEQYLATETKIKTFDGPEINWTNSFRRMFKESKVSIDVNWTGALHRMFREPRSGVNHSSEFDLSESLDAMFGDIYAVVENVPTFSEPLKSYSASIIFAATDVLVQHEAKHSKSFDDMKYRGMELAIGAFQCFKKVDRELVDSERSDMVNTRKSEICSYGQSVTSTLAMVDIA